MTKFTVWLKDTAERAGSAYVYALATAFVATEAADLASWKAWALAAIAPALSVVKAAIASRFGNAASPSFIPNLPLEQVKADPPSTGTSLIMTRDKEALHVIELERSR